MSDDSPGIVVRPGLTLEDVREHYAGHEPHGRGRETAAPRGYNAERLSNALLDEYAKYTPWSPGPWVDHVATTPSGVRCYVEVKTTIDQYPSQTHGRFQIWATHHYRLLGGADVYEATRRLHLYLFVVYTIEAGIEREVGKVLVPAVRVEDQIDTWSKTDHVTMGEDLIHTVSWRALIDALDVSPAEFRSTDTVDLTAGTASLECARSHTDS